MNEKLREELDDQKKRYEAMEEGEEEEAEGDEEAEVEAGEPDEEEGGDQ